MRLLYAAYLCSFGCCVPHVSPRVAAACLPACPPARLPACPRAGLTAALPEASPSSPPLLPAVPSLPAPHVVCCGERPVQVRPPVPAWLAHGLMGWPASRLARGCPAAAAARLRAMLPTAASPLAPTCPLPPPPHPFCLPRRLRQSVRQGVPPTALGMTRWELEGLPALLGLLREWHQQQQLHGGGGSSSRQQSAGKPQVPTRPASLCIPNSRQLSIASASMPSCTPNRSSACPPARLPACSSTASSSPS